MGIEREFVLIICDLHGCKPPKERLIHTSKARICYIVFRLQQLRFH